MVSSNASTHVHEMMTITSIQTWRLFPPMMWQSASLDTVQWVWNSFLMPCGDFTEKPEEIQQIWKMRHLETLHETTAKLLYSVVLEQT